jgi:hypothetical protein
MLDAGGRSACDDRDGGISCGIVVVVVTAVGGIVAVLVVVIVIVVAGIGL